VEESVDCLEKNLDSVKSVMQDRIAEDKIGKLQSQQMVLANKQVEMEAKLHEELRRMEAAKSAVDAGPTPLRLTAPPFVPTTTSPVPLESEAGVGARAEEGRSTKGVGPSPFDG
jgi:hypothetical protein